MTFLEFIGGVGTDYPSLFLPRPRSRANLPWQFCRGHDLRHGDTNYEYSKTER